jgi:aryl-alcohol dehydrogenase-like predicted oxidoreductase/NAD-dependent dihydropyrimidine dehydrogenase PreA subunit
LAIKKYQLGRTGLEVTELCFGVLPMGKLQKNLPEAECVALLQEGARLGINFFDTAEAYNTQAFLGKAFQGDNERLVIATKSHATGYKEMQASVEKSLAELKRDVIDIYHLHAARVDESVFAERAGALECLLDYKAKGKIRAVGIATHNVKVVKAAAEREDIDVVFPLLNKAGRGIIDGTVADMIEAIGQAGAAGKGVYIMKSLAGGNLLNEIKAAFEFVRQVKGSQAIAVGMVGKEEIAYNCAYFAGEEVPEQSIAGQQKRLSIQRFCKGCGTCVEYCPNGALSLRDGKAVVDHSLCILCGYCSPHCPQFAIRLV